MTLADKVRRVWWVGFLEHLGDEGHPQIYPTRRASRRGLLHVHVDGKPAHVPPNQREVRPPWIALTVYFNTRHFKNTTTRIRTPIARGLVNPRTGLPPCNSSLLHRRVLTAARVGGWCCEEQCDRLQRDEDEEGVSHTVQRERMSGWGSRTGRYSALRAAPPRRPSRPCWVTPARDCETPLQKKSQTCHRISMIIETEKRAWGHPQREE